MTRRTKVEHALTIFMVAAFFFWVLTLIVYGKDGDDHGNHGALKPWFDGLKSDRGLCCSFADGKVVTDVDWDTACDKPNCHYRVRIDGQWLGVPDAAVIKEPNRFGPAVVWPIEYPDATNGGKMTAYDVRCFMPGAGT